MYCSKCGNLVTEGLKYCNNCGARLTRELENKEGTPGKMLDKLLTTLFLIVMFGMGILIGLVAVLLGNGQKPEVVTLITVAYLLAIFGICFTLVRQVPKLIDAKLKGWSNEPEVIRQPQLVSPVTGQLEEYRQPIGSVTDHTTKTLAYVPVKRN